MLSTLIKKSFYTTPKVKLLDCFGSGIQLPECAAVPRSPDEAISRPIFATGLDWLTRQQNNCYASWDL